MKIPKIFTVLDVETQSRCNIKECGGWAYSEDDSTRLFSLTWLTVNIIKQTRSIGIWVPNRDPEDFNVEVVKKELGITCDVSLYLTDAPPIQLIESLMWPTVAHNCEFELSILMNTLGLDTRHMQWFCTMGMARYFRVPASLGNLASYLKLGAKDAGGEMMINLSKPDKYECMYEIAPFMVQQCVQYNIVDVLLTERIFKQFIPSYPEKEHEFFMANLATNSYGINVDMDLVDGMKGMQTRMMMDMKLPQGVSVGDLTRVQKLKQTLKNAGLKDLENLDKNNIDQILKKHRLSPYVREILVARREVARASYDKLDAIERYKSHDGFVRGQIEYCGTSTGRGRGHGVQFQNFSKPSKSLSKKDKILAIIDAVKAGDYNKARELGNGSISEALIACLRPIIIPHDPENQMLVISDYAQVEARGAMWLAEDEKHLSWWLTRDMYSEMASRLFGREIKKGRDDKERDVGKRVILSSIFGVGADKFDNECRVKYDIDLKSMGLDAVKVIEEFRSEFASLADYENGMWARLDKMMKDCLITGNDQTYGINRVFLTARRFRDNVRVMLPSGRELFFPECKIEEFTKTSKSGKPYTARSFTARNPNGTREEYYGGKFADIFTQSTCADLLRHTVIECWKHGFPTMMHVHDENVSVVPRKDAQKHLETIEHLMINPGPWASGFPIAVESILCDRYLKG